jgi:hypothetical protein
MRRFLTPLVIAGTLAATAPASAQTNFTVNAQFSPASTVLYLPFHVFTGGTFNFLTISGFNQIDPMLRLYTGLSTTGAGLGGLVAVDDDGAPATPGWNDCTGAGGQCNALISALLGVGNYTLAMSVWDFTDLEARTGASSWNDGHQNYCSNDGNWADCNYDVKVWSENGTAAVPEPASMVLMATGLAGIGAWRRRRQNS